MVKKRGKNKYRLVAFDLDGTLIDGTSSLWRTMHEFLGILEHPKRIELREQFMAGRIDYARWADEDMKLMMAHGLDRGKMLAAMKGLSLVKGARETLQTLKAKGMKLALISGSLDIVLDKLMPDYREVFDHTYILGVIFDAQGKVKGVDTRHDAWNKHKALTEICEAEGISLDECVFVGDHANDVSAAKAAGLSIAFDPKSEKLKEVSDVVIEKKDLREVLKYVLAPRGLPRRR